MTKRKGGKCPPTGDYTCGYGRPPVHTQIKPGEVRNRFGRGGKPKADNGCSILSKVLAQPVPMQLGAQSRIVTTEEALLTCLADSGLRRDLGSAKYLLTAQREARRAAAQTEATLCRVASIYQKGWQKAYEQGVAHSLDHLPVHPDDMIIDLETGQVRLKVISADGLEGEIIPLPHILLSMLEASMPPEVDERGAGLSAEHALSEFAMLARKGRGEAPECETVDRSVSSYGGDALQ